MQGESLEAFEKSAIQNKYSFREVMVLITGANKSIALYKAIEEGVCHMWTVSAFQQHPNTLMVCDEDATMELKVKTVKYFKDMWNIHASLNEDLSEAEMRKLSLGDKKFG